MAEYLIQSETLDDIADAINAKTGGSSAMTPAEMVTAIAAIETGGGSSETSIVSVTEYTHDTAWDESASGNTLAFVNRYFNSGNGMYYAEIENTLSETTNSAKKAFFGRFDGLRTTGYAFCSFLRNNEGNNAYVAAVSGSFSFLIGQGSTVKVYYISEENL